LESVFVADHALGVKIRKSPCFHGERHDDSDRDAEQYCQRRPSQWKQNANAKQYSPDIYVLDKIRPITGEYHATDPNDAEYDADPDVVPYLAYAALPISSLIVHT
jgi:hypothetical protein